MSAARPLTRLRFEPSVWRMSLILDPVYAYKRNPMGEVKVRVKLTNGVDEALCRFQQLGIEQVRSRETEAMVDTGAVRMVVPPQIVEQLGLPIRGQRVAEYADGRKESVGVTGPLIVEI